MTSEELGAKLGLSGSRMARMFKSETGMSLVEYRNRLRLERFSTLLDQTGDNLLEAALSAGFGSYAQFHRVFCALRGTTPRKYLRTVWDAVAPKITKDCARDGYYEIALDAGTLTLSP